MPVYEFKCDTCGYREERLLHMTDDLEDMAPICTGYPGYMNGHWERKMRVVIQRAGLVVNWWRDHTRTERM
jgi:predicted nucleic acid-binding Zn ribbon protein